MMKQSTEEDAISHTLLETAVILSSSELAGNYGVDIRAVDGGGTAVEEDENDQEGKVRKLKKTRKVSIEGVGNIKDRERELLKEAFKSLEINQYKINGNEY
jgi:hypothetical protein